MKPRWRSFFQGEGGERTEINEVRQRLFDQVRYPFLILGLFAAVMGSLQSCQQGQWGFAIVYSGSYLIFVATAFAGKRIPLAARSLALILALFAVAVSILLRIGLSGIGLEMLLLACAVASALLGKRIGLSLVGIGAVAVVLIGAGMVAGMLPVRQAHMLTSLSALAWATSLVVFCMVGVGLVILPQMFLTRLKGSLETLEEHTHRLERSNASLKETIHARKAAEKALREKQERLRILFDHAADAIFVSKPDGKMVQANRRACQTTGYTPEEILGLSITDIDADHTSLEQLQTIFDDLEPGSHRTIESRHRRKDGTVFPVEVTIAVLQTPNGPHVIGIARDITARKRFEEELLESENRFRELFDTISDVIYTQDLDGRFLSVNPALCHAFGYTADELIGRRASEFMKPEFSEAFKSEYLAQIKNSGYHEGAAAYFTKSGDKIYLEYRSTLIRPDNDRPYISGIGRQVTDKIMSRRKLSNLREQITQAQKLESIGTLAGGIAHNFNNVLMGIQGRTSLMMMDKDAAHPDYEHLQGIAEYVQGAAELTKDLLGFARGGKYEVKPTDINRLIKHENRMFGQTKKEVKIRGKYEKRVWTVEVDQGQIRQALLNLYVNAWQAMPEGGNLYVQTRNITAADMGSEPVELPPGRYVKISVTDTGVGMDAETQQKIFDPFFTTKEVGDGTGLGLAFVYGIVKNHGGVINVTSEKGQGTTFNTYLPASDKTVVEEKKTSGTPVKGEGTIMLVDDEKMIVDVGKQLLERLGYSVLTAHSGKEAITLYEKSGDGIDLVILDMIMPGMSGGETYDQLKTINPNVRALLSSGYSINGQAQSIIDRGCNGFLQKPFNIKEISLKVSEILGQHPAH